MSIQNISNDSNIAIYVVDEHHEAYLVWANTLAANFSGRRALVHIDEHADFGVPHLTEPIPKNDDPIEVFKKFVYQQLTIGTFLIPSAVAGFYSDLFWIKPSRKLKHRKESLYVNRLVDIPFVGRSNIASEGSREICYLNGGWELSSVISGEWMLDICLDAFICNSNLDHDPFILEITESQFDSLNTPKLNMWNLRYGSAATFFKSDGKFFFKLAVGTWSGPENIVRSNDYRKKIKKFEKFLLSIKHPPTIITLSRSIKSGYTPREIALDLENSVKNIIFKTYSL
jgi:hypothetical protein